MNPSKAPAKRHRRLEITALSRAQELDIDDTWALLQKDLQVHGQYMYDNMYSRTPDMLRIFTSFMPKDRNKRPRDYSAAAFKTMVEACLTLRHANSPDGYNTRNMLRKVGSQHFLHGVNPMYYDVVKASLMSTLEHGLGKSFTAEVKAAWAQAFDELMDFVIEGEMFAEPLSPLPILAAFDVRPAVVSREFQIAGFLLDTA
jgi:hemoglobin-like flavoprotein